jgi:hypothetical protein
MRVADAELLKLECTRCGLMERKIIPKPAKHG